MSRAKPSAVPGLRAVDSTDAGEILEEETPPDPIQTKVEQWEQSIYRGPSVLEIPSRRWALPGWLPLDASLALYGPAGTGKSLYALALALELARGGRWAGWQLNSEPVLYVAAERPTDQRDRAEAWRKHHETELPAGFSMLAPPRPPQLTDPLHVEALCRLVEQQGARVVILDTFARMTLGLEENSAREMGPVMEALDRIRAATRGGFVMLVHHTGKDPGKGLRGSTAMLGALDLTIELEGGTDGIVKASVPKANAGPKPIPEWYRISPVLLPALPGEVENRSVPVMLSSARPDTGPDAEILELVGLYVSASRRQILDGLRTEYGLELGDSSVERRLKALTDSGRLTRAGRGPATRYELPDLEAEPEPEPLY